MRPTAGSKVLVTVLCCAFAALLGCEDRTAEERGEDYAEERLGFAQGAAGELEKRGKALGKTTGKGLGDLVRGVGGGVTDAVRPQVQVQPGRGVAEGGITIGRAAEGEATDTARSVEVHLTFARTFSGRLSLVALAGDQEVARGELPESVSEAADSAKSLLFLFPPSTRLSSVERYRLDVAPPKEVSVHAGAAGVSVSQLTESAQGISVYVTFAQRFRGGLELRAFDGQGAEIGRSEPSEQLNRAPDSAEFMTFTFDARARLDRAVRYEMRKR